MLKTVDQVKAMIAEKKSLLLAGDEALLKQLPAGNWIAGTIPYFMDEKGGTVEQNSIFVTEVSAESTIAGIKTYGVQDISEIAKEAPENGYTLLIIPATSEVHVKYAEDAAGFDQMFLKPVLGWISGVHLNDLGKVSPKVFCGNDASAYSDKAVAMHVTIPVEKSASIGIVNLFKQGEGDTITFPKGGFEVTSCIVNGEERDFAAYVRQKGIDTKLPLVADYSGTNINVSIQEVKEDTVVLYAPVFESVEYRFAAPVDDYVKQFNQKLPQGVNAAFSCNCILNFLYSELEGKVTGGMYGPVTFGEIAYQLLNQTLVYLEIK